MPPKQSADIRKNFRTLKKYLISQGDANANYITLLMVPSIPHADDISLMAVKLKFPFINRNDAQQRVAIDRNSPLLEIAAPL